MVERDGQHFFVFIDVEAERSSGDSWSVVGSPTRKVTCSLRCVLRDGAGNQDVVTCSPAVSPGNKTDPVCEGFLLGKRWTTAT